MSKCMHIVMYTHCFIASCITGNNKNKNFVGINCIYKSKETRLTYQLHELTKVIYKFISTFGLISSYRSVSLPKVGINL